MAMIKKNPYTQYKRKLVYIVKNQFIGLVVEELIFSSYASSFLFLNVSRKEIL
jgi:hypothetical protein